MGSAYSASEMYSSFAVGVVFLFSISPGLGDEAAAPSYSCPENDINFYKNNIQTIKDPSLTWHGCGELCEKKAGCSHWTIHHCIPDLMNGECWPFGTEVCNLKTSDGGLEKKKGYTSGARGCK